MLREYKDCEDSGVHLVCNKEMTSLCATSSEQNDNIRLYGNSFAGLRNHQMD